MIKTTVSVFGTIFVDCKGFALANYQPAQRNLGSIQFVHGGVGRNVAENLSQLEINTAFISGADRTAIGKDVVEHLHEVGITTPFMKFRDSHGMGMWLAILNENGELAGSISQMPDLTLMSAIVDEHGAEIVENSDYVVLVLDINEQITSQVLQLCHEFGKPVFGIPANLDVLSQHPELLNGLRCFICNNYEMDTLAEVAFSDSDVTTQQGMLIDFVQQRELNSMIVTLGENGAIFYDAATKVVGYQPVFPIDVVDSSGAGDAFFSGAIAALVRGATIDQAALCGTIVASWTIAHKQSICPDLRSKMKADPIVMSILSHIAPEFQA